MIFPSPVGRGFKERDLIQRAFFERDSRFCLIEPVRSDYLRRGLSQVIKPYAPL